jgi:heavy metal sensor kinase
MFQVERNPGAVDRLKDEFAIALRAADGSLLDTMGPPAEAPFFPLYEGMVTLPGEGEPWRVYGQSLGEEWNGAWLQVAQELDPVLAALANLRRQWLWAVPLALLLAGLGGFFLAGRALRPVERVTQTAQAISADDLGRRIAYRGPDDEIGRLAQTFDAMLDRLQGAFDRERRFTGDAAHELRTPLTALKGRIEVTLSRPRTPEAYRQTLDELGGQVDRLIRLSNDLLFMTSLEQGQMRPQWERVDLAGFLEAAADQARPLAEAKSIALTERAPAGVFVHGDFDLMLRLLLNLLDNALKYTPPGGRVRIEGRRLNEKVQVAVKDSGPGIAPDHLPHLFDRFYRVQGDRSRSSPENAQSGAGLGLAISCEIARALGGSLAVESAEGQGTTFLVELPAA